MSDTYTDHRHPPGWENELDPRCQACAQSELASSDGSACPICHDPACMGNECSAPLDEWERGDAEAVHVISGACVPVCPYCGAPMGINPSDGKLGCPHPFCCYLGEKPKEAK